MDIGFDPYFSGTFSRLDGKRIAVVGDMMLDGYYWGDVKRISPEAPVPVVKVKNIEERIGGAGNVADATRKWRIRRRRDMNGPEVNEMQEASDRHGAGRVRRELRTQPRAIPNQSKHVAACITAQRTEMSGPSKRGRPARDARTWSRGRAISGSLKGDHTANIVKVRGGRLL